VDVGLGVLVLEGLTVVLAKHAVGPEPELVGQLGVAERPKLGVRLLEKRLGALRHVEQGLGLRAHARQRRQRTRRHKSVGRGHRAEAGLATTLALPVGLRAPPSQLAESRPELGA
jgi:hypothetical protein